MNTSDSSAPNDGPNKRGRKPRTSSQQILTEARKLLAQAQERHEKALARVTREQAAELAQNGRRIYLAAIEQMHSGERALLVDPVLTSLAEQDRSAVQVWLDALDRA